MERKHGVFQDRFLKELQLRRVTTIDTANKVLATVATYSNLDKTTGWVQKSLSLAPYKGQTIRLYFHVTTDSSLTTNASSGPARTT